MHSTEKETQRCRGLHGFGWLGVVLTSLELFLKPDFHRVSAARCAKPTLTKVDLATQHAPTACEERILRKIA